MTATMFYAVNNLDTDNHPCHRLRRRCNSKLHSPSGDGLSCGVSPASVTLGGVNSETANLTIDTSSTTAAATCQIKVAGVSEATHHCATFHLTVQ